jgi:hypothetical protein
MVECYLSLVMVLPVHGTVPRPLSTQFTYDNVHLITEPIGGTSIGRARGPAAQLRGREPAAEGIRLRRDQHPRQEQQREDDQQNPLAAHHACRSGAG